MTIDVRIVGTDAKGRESPLEIGTRNFAQVAVREGDPPPIGEASRFRYFNDLLGSTGGGSGVTNQNVNGSVTSQKFYIGSTLDYDIRVMKIVVFIGDTSITHGDFGNVSALSTGWDLAIEEEGEETLLIDKAKTSGEVIIQSATALAWGDSATSFELTNYSGTLDATVVVLDMASVVPNGLRIGRGTSTEMRSVVNDDLTGLNDFTVRAIGYRWYA